MRSIPSFFKAGLCLLLSLQLAFPAGIRAAEDRRDLVVEELKEKAALWVLAIGVSNYADERINLSYADHDAIQIAQMLKTQEGLLFREVFTHVLVNDRATREEILRAMSKFLGQAAPEDVIVVFLAGHGLQDRQTGTYYFVPHNANTESLVYAGLPMPMFEEAVKRLRTNVDKLVLLLDTCHAGAMKVTTRGVNTGEDLAEALAKASGQYVLSASKAGEESLEDESFAFEGSERAHGAFTYSLLRGFQGAAADSSGVIWLSDLFGHVSREVPRLTQGQQHPHSQIQGTDLPLFILGEGAQLVIQQGVNLPPGTVVVLGQLPQKKGRKKWLWLLLGAAVVGGAGAAVASGGGGGDGGPATGGIEIKVEAP